MLKIFAALFSILAFCFTAVATEGPEAGQAPEDESASSAAAESPAKEKASGRYAWPFEPEARMKFRGGTTRGTEVTLDESPRPAWEALQEDGLSDFEKDRRAILALTGDYRVSFQFIETMGFESAYEPPRPYFSWGSERVQLIEDSGERIRLQHIMVMSYVDEDGNIKGPFVMKHWRQDWNYQDADAWSYEGEGVWQKKTSEDVRGQWTQTVFQVDDSPRYEAVGKWKHHGVASTFSSETVDRPVPRREYTVREDYDLLSGEHFITILPTGWVHEQRNRKVALDDPGGEVVAKEVGFARYESITEPSMAPSEDYWKETGPFWQIVRDAWTEEMSERDALALKSEVDGQKLWQYMFTAAAEVPEAPSFDKAKWQERVSGILAEFIAEPGEQTGAADY